MTVTQYIIGVDNTNGTFGFVLSIICDKDAIRYFEFLQNIEVNLALIRNTYNSRKTLFGLNYIAIIF